MIKICKISIVPAESGLMKRKRYNDGSVAGNASRRGAGIRAGRCLTAACEAVDIAPNAGGARNMNIPYLDGGDGSAA